MRLFPAALLLLIGPLPALAQIPIHQTFDGEKSSVGLQLGPGLPTGTNGFANVAGRGPSLHLTYLHYLNDWISGGAAISMYKLGSAGLGDGTTYEGTAEAGAKSFSLVLRINLMREGHWTPYALAGVGYGIMDLSANAKGLGGTLICEDAAAASTCAAEKSFDLSKSGRTVTTAVGLERLFGKGLSLSLEGRYQQFEIGSAPNASIALPSSTAAVASALIGLHFWF